MKKLDLHGLIDMNCYLIIDKNDCMIIDPGTNKAKIQTMINDLGLNVKGILLTHGHLDHIGALDCFNVPIYVHKDELKLVLDNDLNGFNLFKIPCPLELADLDYHLIDDGEIIKLNDLEIKTIHTPGHTAGGCCFLVDRELYTGDTLFKQAIGRYDLPTSNLEQLKHSIVKIIDQIDETVLVYPGHGESSTILFEKKNNPYYQHFKQAHH